MAKLKKRAQYLKAETLVLYLAVRHPGTPWYAKLFVAALVAYAFSPIDLIPDFIPVIGYLDELVILPFGIALAIRMVPPSVMDECRVRALETITKAKRIGRIAGAVIIVIWIVVGAMLVSWAYKTFMPASSTPVKAHISMFI